MEHTFLCLDIGQGLIVRGWFGFLGGGLDFKMAIDGLQGDGNNQN
jgi:hypothetical protein